MDFLIKLMSLIKLRSEKTDFSIKLMSLIKVKNEKWRF